MPHVEIQTRIVASPARIWEILTDAARLQQGYGILRIQGRIAPGEKLRLRSEAAPKRVFSLKVTGFEPGQRMIWRGGMPLGLFTGTRTYQLTHVSPDLTDFSMREEFTGPLAGMVFSSMPDLNPSFAKFAAQLKKDAEA